MEIDVSLFPYHTVSVAASQKYSLGMQLMFVDGETCFLISFNFDIFSHVMTV